MKPYQVVTATRGTSLTSTQRLLLIQVAFRAGDGGACWASAKTLGDDVGVDERTIRRLLAQLVDVGALSRERRPGRPDVYRVTFTPGTMSDRTPCPDPTPDTMSGVSGHHVRGERAPCPPTPDTMSDDQIPDQSHEQIPDQSQEPTGGGTALEDAPTVEDTTACTMVVRGRVAPDPDAPTELQVAELVALQQTAMPSRADHDAVTRLLVRPGVTAEVARAMWEAAATDDWWQETTDTGEPRLRWRSLAKPGPGLDKRIGAAQEAVAELARRTWRNRSPPPPPPPKKWDPLAKRRFETDEQHAERLANYAARSARAEGAK